MKAVIIHAYSRHNSGDGLLVDETLALAREADLIVQCLVSWDPLSFEDLEIPVLHPLTGDSTAYTRRGLARSLVTQAPHPKVRREISAADVVLAVGGGYLRAGSMVEYGKSALAHRVQLPSSRWGRKAVYLPQSIGPHPPRLLPGFASRLGRAAHVFVRDGRSEAELQERGVAARRVPDLAVLAIGHRPPEPVSGGGPIGIVLRDLQDAPPSYHAQVKKLVRLVEGELLVQSSGGGNDDPAYYSRLGYAGVHRSLGAALTSPEPPSMTVSVRLHGSIQSILAGVPSVHLSYERKGWGAYEDLGIERYLRNARSFDAEEVASVASSLSQWEDDYWMKVQKSVSELNTQRGALIAAIRSIHS